MEVKPQNNFGGEFDHPFPTPCGFLKNVFSKRRAKTWFSVTSNITTKIAQFSQKTRRIYLPILAIFIKFNQFFGFLIFSSYKETNNVSL